MPALYTGPHEYGSTHPDPQAAIDVAQGLTDAAEDDLSHIIDPEATATRILCGLATRTDLTETHVDRITALESCNGAVLAALIANPALSATNLADLLSPTTLPLFLLRHDVTDIADQIIRDCPHGQNPRNGTEVDLLTAIRALLGQTAIEDYFTRALADPAPAAVLAAAENPLLSPGGFDRALAIAEDSGSTVQLALDVLRALSQRGDLTDTQGLRLISAIRAVSPRSTRDTARWLLSALVMNQRVPQAVMVKMLTYPARWAPDLVLTVDHVTPETVFAAARTHLPHAVMRLPNGVRLPTDAAHAVLADLETGTARKRDLAPDEIHRYTRQVVRHCDDTDVWDRAVPLFVASAPETELTGISRHGFAFTYALLPDQPRAFRRDPAREERVYAWLSAHPDPCLRIASLGRLYLREQVLAATCDPHETVRAAVLFHPLADTAMLGALAADPSTFVRVAVAEHPQADEAILARLNADEDPSVRNAVANRFVAALADTS